MATQHDFYQVIESLHQAGIKNLVRLVPRTKEPQVLGGRKVTTDSPSVAESWFRGSVRLPNLGVLAGNNGLIFIDVDASNGKKINPKDVLGALGVQTACTSTARGGAHLWFSVAGEQNPTALRLNLTKILKGVNGFGKIDIKQGDSYVVIPPSDLPQGTYEWVNEPWVIAPTPLPTKWCGTEGLPEVVTPEPTPAEFQEALSKVAGTLPKRAIELISGKVPSNDRSDQAFELGHLLFEAGLRGEREIALLVRGSEIHRRKFARRHDGWADACRIAHRVIASHTPEPNAQPTTYEIINFAQIEQEFRDPQFLIYPLLPRGEITLLDGDDGIGKAVALDTLIPTPDGFKQMANINTGDVVIDGTGAETKVLWTSPAHYNHRCYEVCFDDGTKVIADAEHQWLVQTVQQRTNTQKWLKNPKRQAPNRKPSHSIVTTEEMLKTLRAWNDRVLNYSVDIKPFRGTHRELLVPPYTLGAWLGDGTAVYAEITTQDEEILQHIAADGVCNRKQGCLADTYWLGATKHVPGATKQDSLQSKLRSIGVLGNKHIPQEYLFSSFDQRLALLQGLMDTDGHVMKTGVCEFTTTDQSMAEQFRILATSLGIKCHLKTRQVKGFGKITTAYRVFFTTNLPVCRLQRKAARLPKKVRPTTRRRYVAAINEVKSVPVKCIAVESPEHTYMCTDNFIITHNSWVWIALVAGLTGSRSCPVPYDHTAPRNANVLVLTAEDDPRVTLGPRLKLLGANLSRVNIISPAGAEYVNGITAGELESAWETIRGLKPDLIVVDHITIFEMSVSKLDSSNAGQVRKMLNALKALAKNLECAVLVVRHFRKGQGSAKDRGIGSIAYRATARSHIVVGFDPEDTTRSRRIITQVKMNLVPKLDEGIVYTITRDDGFAWAGTCDVNPDSLTDSNVAARLAENATKLEVAVEFLREALGNGPVAVMELVRAAKREDITKRTLERAAKKLHTLSKRDGFGGKVMWVLPN